MPGSLQRRDVPALKTALDEGRVPLLVDVRSPAEFASGHVPGAVNHPLGSLDPSAYDADAIWVICRSGARSNQAAQRLSAAGHTVFDVAGGTMAWQAAGHAVEADPNASHGVTPLLPMLLCLTLGLAPFFPEPHLLGKLRWVAGGAVGMGAMDWFDLAMHGAPFLWMGWVLLSGRKR